MFKYRSKVRSLCYIVDKKCLLRKSWNLMKPTYNFAENIYSTKNVSELYQFPYHVCLEIDIDLRVFNK